MSNLRVLLVDDNQDLRMGLVRQLRQHGAEVLEAANGKQAREVLTRTSVNVAVVDVGLGLENGAEVADDLRTYAGHLPIVLMSGQCELGGDVLRKPFGIEDLLAAIRKAML